MVEIMMLAVVTGQHEERVRRRDAAAPNSRRPGSRRTRPLFYPLLRRPRPV